MFFRSPFVLVHLGAVAALGSGVAFAVAMGAYGHLNAATSFLGSFARCAASGIWNSAPRADSAARTIT